MRALHERASCARRIDDDPGPYRRAVLGVDSGLPGSMLQASRPIRNDLHPGGAKCAPEETLQLAGVELGVGPSEDPATKRGDDRGFRPRMLDQMVERGRNLVGPKTVVWLPERFGLGRDEDDRGSPLTARRGDRQRCRTASQNPYVVENAHREVHARGLCNQRQVLTRARHDLNDP